jgi:hypothetical protein
MKKTGRLHSEPLLPSGELERNWENNDRSIEYSSRIRSDSLRSALKDRINVCGKLCRASVRSFLSMNLFFDHSWNVSRERNLLWPGHLQVPGLLNCSGLLPELQR